MVKETAPETKVTPVEAASFNLDEQVSQGETKAKKLKWYIVSAIVLSLIVASAIFFWPRVEKISPPKEDITAEVKPSPKLTTWDDPAGFTIEYPEALELDKHDEDKENYAQVELTSKEASGSVIIWAKDPIIKGKTITSAAEWVKQEVSFKDANVLDTSLGEEEAKKILLTSPKKVIIGTVFDEVLWYIEGTYEDATFWQPVFDTVSKSFAFKHVGNGVKQPTSGNEPVVSEESVDEEEVLE